MDMAYSGLRKPFSCLHAVSFKFVVGPLEKDAIIIIFKNYNDLIQSNLSLFWSNINPKQKSQSYSFVSY